jgi:hypothetical protein
MKIKTCLLSILCLSLSVITLAQQIDLSSMTMPWKAVHNSTIYETPMFYIGSGQSPVRYLLVKVKAPYLKLQPLTLHSYDYLMHLKTTLELTWDVHSHEHDEGHIGATTYFVPLDSNDHYIKISGTDDYEEVEWIIHHDAYVDQSTTSTLSSTCDVPSLTYKSRIDWACPDGDKAPLWNPVASPTKTFVIHHQAGTANPPYDATVRGIWNYHTYTNGWGDIGYNWLIAPDGTLYQGRAWVDANTQQVKAAHMCACNSNKIGICLLGNLTNSKPTQAAYDKLVHLLALKACDFDISPTGNDITPIREESGCVDKSSLNIIGHREGCPDGYTACPGDAFFPDMAKLRLDVDNFLKSYTATHDVETSPIKIRPNPAHDHLTIDTDINGLSSYEISNILGISVVKNNLKSTYIDISRLTPGLYIITFAGLKGKESRLFEKL